MKIILHITVLWSSNPWRFENESSKNTENTRCLLGTSDASAACSDAASPQSASTPRSRKSWKNTRSEFERLMSPPMWYGTIITSRRWKRHFEGWRRLCSRFCWWLLHSWLSFFSTSSLHMARISALRITSPRNRWKRLRLSWLMRRRNMRILSTVTAMRILGLPRLGPFVKITNSGVIILRCSPCTLGLRSSHSTSAFTFS